MANREALRELQTRLAQRMQAARDEAPGLAWLAVECAGHGLLLPLQQAGEIFPVGAVLTVPHTQPWFAGVANLRGSLYGVVDLAAFLGLRSAPAERDSHHEQARVLALAPTLGVNCALLVDRMAGLRNEQQLTRQAAQPGARPAFAAATWHDDAGREWQELELAGLAGHPHFLAIPA